MDFCLPLAVIFGKLVSLFSRFLHLGAGGTWSGHLALKTCPRLVDRLEAQLPRGSILITGTNGKTTTAKLLSSVLEALGFSVLRNHSGANLLNGIASSLILSSDIVGKMRAEVGVFEVDEAEFPNVLEQIRPEVVIVLNLFRDQLDRYAELDFTASRWRQALRDLPSSTRVILNADDPLVASLGEDLDALPLYFGLKVSRLLKSQPSTIADSLHCPKCGESLSYRGFYYSHIGVWQCPKCGRERPKLEVLCSEIELSENSSKVLLRFKEGFKTELEVPLAGLFNVYNILAAALASRLFEVNVGSLSQIWANFDPAFGRQEEFVADGRKVKILLSKNPTGFSENLKLLRDQNSAVLLVLNDGIADGRDVSWIWDVDFEILNNFEGAIWVSGRRKEDLGLRLKYAGLQNTENRVQNLKEAVASALKSIPEGGTLCILPTYTAMLEVRKILRGRSIL